MLGLEGGSFSLCKQLDSALSSSASLGGSMVHASSTTVIKDSLGGTWALLCKVGPLARRTTCALSKGSGADRLMTHLFSVKGAVCTGTDVVEECRLWLLVQWVLWVPWVLWL